MSRIVNLEPLCAEYGMKLVDTRRQTNPETAVTDCENVINKALGILVENGFYAMSVFLLSCNKPDYGREVLRTLMDMLCDPRAALLSGGLVDDVQTSLALLRNLTEDLPRLMLARRLGENALIFGRYHCKALSREGR